jgi:hypothetical protein
MAQDTKLDKATKIATIMGGLLPVFLAVYAGISWVNDHSSKLATLEAKYTALAEKTEILRVSHDKLIVSVVKMNAQGAGTKEIETPDVVDKGRDPTSDEKAIPADSNFTLPNSLLRGVASYKKPENVDFVKVQMQEDGSAVLKASKGHVLKARKLKDGSLQIFSKESP